MAKPEGQEKEGPNVKDLNILANQFERNIEKEEMPEDRVLIDYYEALKIRKKKERMRFLKDQNPDYYEQFVRFYYIGAGLSIEKNSDMTFETEREFMESMYFSFVNHYRALQSNKKMAQSSRARDVEEETEGSLRDHTNVSSEGDITISEYFDTAINPLGKRIYFKDKDIIKLSKGDEECSMVAFKEDNENIESVVVRTKIDDEEVEIAITENKMSVRVLGDKSKFQNYTANDWQSAVNVRIKIFKHSEDQIDSRKASYLNAITV